MKPLLLLSVILLAGCAGSGDLTTACRNADWYDLGFRDAIYRLQPQDLVYTSRCESSGAKVDVARYTQGWREGKYEADARDPGPID